MKNIRKITALILTVIMLFAVTSAPAYAFCEDGIAKLENIFSPKLIAHRGFSGQYPQNTIPAFEGAVEAGFWGVECDIHTTKDGKWVVIHDDEISNLTNGTGYVRDKTFAEIQEIRMDSGNGIENYGTLPIPTLEEYLDVCLTGDIVPVIEIKGCDTKYLPSLKETLDAYGLSDKVVIISFNKSYMEGYRALDPDATMFYLMHEPDRDTVDYCREYNFGVNLNNANFLKCYGALIYARIHGVPVATWTVDNLFLALIFKLFGADYVTTNSITPEILSSWGS